MNQALVIDDDEDYRNLLIRKLERSYPGLTIHAIDPLDGSLPGKEYSWKDIDFIILDYQLGLEYTGLDWFKQFKNEDMPATILLTARGSEELAVRAIKLGIDDYIVKEHFENETLTNSINECVYNKKLERAKFHDLSHRSVIFNKPGFIRRLGSIIRNKDTRNHLFMFNPEAYEKIGKEIGIGAQDNYINHVTDSIYQSLSYKKIDCNIFIYRDEYIAVIIEAASHKRYLKNIYKKLWKEKIKFGVKEYSCACSVGVISPKNMDSTEVIKSDFELLDIAQVLCDSAKSGTKDHICNYGDIGMGDIWYLDGEPITTHTSQSFDIEKAIGDGRVSTNYQPWVYISTDETVNLKDVYDVRIEVIDTEGNKIAQRDLLGLLAEAFAKRIVDRWVLRHTVAQLTELAERSGKINNIKLAVKITLSSISDPEFIPWLKMLFYSTDLPGGCLLFEIESAHFFRNPEQYKILINDVGKNYYIKTILSGITEIDTYYKVREIQRFDYIKLNVKDLIHGFPRSPLNRLINTMKDDDAKIVAIHVADAEELNLASEFDIDYVHGYLVGKPYVDLISDSDGDLYCVI